MTQGKAAAFETEVLLFPAEPNTEVVSTAGEKIEIGEAKKTTTLKIDINTRFARLRKSLRKRSASIF